MKTRFVIVVYLVLVVGVTLSWLLAVYALDSGLLSSLFFSGCLVDLVSDALFGVAAPLVLLVAWYRQPIADIGVVNTGVPRIVLWGVLGAAAYFAFVELARLVVRWPYWGSSWRPGLEYLPLWSLVVLRVLSIGLVSPIQQEIFFRGIFQRFAVQRVGRLLGVLITALFFAAWHHDWGAYGDYNAALFVLFAVAGAIYGFLYEKTRSLFAPILAHAAWNTFCVVSEMLL